MSLLPLQAATQAHFDSGQFFIAYAEDLHKGRIDRHDMQDIGLEAAHDVLNRNAGSVNCIDDAPQGVTKKQFTLGIDEDKVRLYRIDAICEACQRLTAIRA